MNRLIHSILGRNGRSTGNAAHATDGDRWPRKSSRPVGRTPLLESFEPRTLLATFSVTNLNDAGAGSLRQAIADSNGAAGADIIEFDTGLTGTIALGGTELAVTDDVAINGPGANLLTVSGNNLSRVFYFQAGTSALSGLTISNGNTTGNGGGIFNENAVLTLTDAIVTGNSSDSHGGGIQSSFGTLTVNNSTFSGNIAIGGGGGIGNSFGELTVTNSTISGNSASFHGGGIYGGTTLTLENSTVSGNTATNSSGGGVYSGDGSALTVTNSTISGNTATASDGGGVYGGNGGTFVVTNSTISENTAAGGRGGGICNVGTFTVADSTISGNTAADGGGGILNNGTLTVTNSTIGQNTSIDNGGGIASYVALTLTNSIISNNETDSDGGGLMLHSGALSATSSIIMANTALGAGGGIGNSTAEITLTGSEVTANSASTHGGGVFNWTGAGAVTITNSTFSGNSSAFGGGVSNAGSQMTITNSTISGNSASASGGGIYNEATLTVISTIVAVNTGQDVSGAFAPGSTNNLVGVDPKLGALANNGGPTQTMALAADSPAIGMGLNPSNLTTDQRGGPFARGTAVDIGAYQRQTLNLVVDTLSDVVDGNHSAGNLSFREAIDAAGPNPGNDTITFATTLNGGTITLGGTELLVSGDVTITGPGANLLSVSGDGLSRVFRFASGSSSLSGLTITGGSFTLAGSGGGVFNEGTLTISDSNISGNYVNAGGGGGIRNVGTLSINNSTISGNGTVTPTGGGGIRNSGTLTIANSTIQGNSSGSTGGILSDGTMTIINSTIAGNRAYSTGGISSTVTFQLISSIVAGNSRYDTVPSDIGGTLASGSTNNLIQDAASAGGLTNGANGNLVGVDPKLGALASNGGPTQTMALAADSPAIGKGINPGNLTTDQRGGLFARGTAVDIGAYQRQTLNLVVDTLVDENDGIFSAGDLSLREAIAVAGSNAGNDTITFATSLNGGTITLGGTELSVTGDATITGPGASLLAVSGDNLSRVFNFQSGSSTLSGLTIIGGNAEFGGDGGGVLNSGTLTIANSTITGNVANRFAAGGGGGVANTGTLTIIGSTITGGGTGTGGGGGVLNSGTMTITGSTISGNSTATPAGGGGILNTGTASIANSTIAGNTSGSIGGILNAGTMTITNSTISGNRAYTTGGIYASGTVQLISSIVAGNSRYDTSPADVGGTLAAGSTNNLIQDAASAGGLTNGVNGNLVGVDPKLSPLANNGGPTQTMALAADSPAINKGLNPGNLTSDQRGGPFARGTAVDIGAYQRQTLNLVVDTLVDENDGIFSAGDLSLREAIAAAAPNPGNDTITFATTLNGGTITLAGTELAVTGDVTITGPGANLLSVSGNNASRVFKFASGTSTLSGITVTGGWNENLNNSGEGAGIRNLGTLQLLNVAVVGNVQLTYGSLGGGVFNETGAVLTVSGSTISGNAAYGGAGLGNRGTATLINTTISGNHADFTGSGIESGGTLTIRNSTIAENSSRFQGGIFIHGGRTAQLISTIVTGNLASEGGVHAYDVSGTLASGSTNNLIGDAASAGGLTNGVDGNIVGVDPKLGALASNGGPTQTMALAADSPAIGKGLNPSNLTTDQRGTGFARARGTAIDIGAYEFSARPTILALTARASNDLNIIVRGGHVSLVANDVRDADGTIARVDFYFDQDGDHIADPGELIGSDDQGDGNGYGYTLGYNLSPTLPLGPASFLAVAVDSDGLSSDPSIGDITIVKTPPTIASVTMSALQVRKGQSVTFTATNVLAGEDAAGITRVEFYRSVVTQSGISSSKVGEDTTPGDGWTYVLDTSGMDVGQPHLIGPGGYNGLVSYYAIAIDSLGNSSAQVNSSDFETFEIQAGFPLLGASTGSSGNLNITAGSSLDLPIIYQQQPGQTTWTKSDLQAKTGSPAITGEIVTWVDPKDGLNYAAAMTADGLGLFTNTTGATWTFRNLSTEVAGIPLITGNLTVFIATDNTVNIAGVTATGDLIRWSQTGEATNANHAWTAHNLGDDLRALGLTVPQFAGRITSFVTPWNALNVVGLDSSGQIQAIWWHQALATEGKWTTNNLSQEYGAPTLTGGLTVWQTSWNAINIAGTDNSGKLAATWWVPNYNNGNWNNNNLTDDIGGPTLQPDSMCSWVTPWGAMNVAGRESDGTIGVYWWVPGHNNNLWNIEHFREEVPGATLTSGPITGITTPGNIPTMNMLSVSPSGEVISLWWTPTTNVWSETNLSQTAIPA